MNFNKFSYLNIHKYINETDATVTFITDVHNISTVVTLFLEG
jgi:hypothetical protein